MFAIDSTNTIHITRGDIGVIELTAMKTATDPLIFKTGDIVRLRVFVKKKHDKIVLQKDIRVQSDVEVVSIPLIKTDTKIGEIINVPEDYWYEIELNPDTTPQTLVGYDIKGPKIFRLYPEGGELA